MIQDASEAALLLAGAVELMVAGAQLAHHHYQDRELKKQKKSIVKVNKIYEKCLKNIQVLGYSGAEMVSLPPIFAFDPYENPKGATVLQLNEAILEDIEKTIAVYNDPQLHKYGHHIGNALAALREFYLTRLKGRTILSKGKDTDVTSSVLCYLILMLSNHCMKFEGYALDIAYLTGLAKFVNEFASLHGKKSERFEHLAKVYSEMMKAKYLLIDHSLSLSIEESVSELLPACMQVTNKMIKLFSKLISPNKYWNDIEAVTIDRLATGIIKPKYLQGHSLKHLFFSNRAVYFPESILSKWIIRCAMDYLRSLNVNKDTVSNEGKGVAISGQKFKMEGYTNQELNEIRKVFAASKNILTLNVINTRDVSLAIREFYPVADKNEINERLGIYLNLAILIDRLISVQYFFSYFWNRTKILGEIYDSIDSPYCDFLFDVLNGLDNSINQLAGTLLESLQKIELSFTDAMLPVKQQQLLLEFRNYLSTVRGRISDSIKAIVIKHNKHKTKTSVCSIINIKKKDKILELAHEMAIEYAIPTTSVPIIQDNKIIKEEKHAEIKVPEVQEFKQEIRVKDVDNVLAKIDARICAIRNTEKLDKRSFSTYFSVYEALVVMISRARAMERENDPSRQEKARKTAALTYALCEEVKGFISQDKQGRLSQTNIFVKKIKDELGHSKNAFLDVHYSKWFLARLFSRGGFFVTISRANAKGVAKACENLSKKMK